MRDFHRPAVLRGAACHLLIRTLYRNFEEL
jgi:hypothetical protein